MMLIFLMGLCFVIILANFFSQSLPKNPTSHLANSTRYYTSYDSQHAKLCHFP